MDKTKAARQHALADLRHYQLDIARAWQTRAKLIADPFAKFMCLFAGFNSIYALLRLEAEENSGEERDISRLVGLLGEARASMILDAHPLDVCYFRGITIQKMKDRTVSMVEGELSEGSKWQRRLAHQPEATERLRALAQILYLVRCNLVHGSKQQMGHDAEIVMHSIPPLEALLASSIAYIEGRNEPRLN